MLKVYADGDLRVAFGGQTWTFNPACLSAQTLEVDANLMTAENPIESGSKDQTQEEGGPLCPSTLIQQAGLREERKMGKDQIGRASCRERV